MIQLFSSAFLADNGFALPLGESLMRIGAGFAAVRRGSVCCGPDAETSTSERQHSVPF
jgi:hypothetical protein